jgi:5'-nucleotidase
VKAVSRLLLVNDDGVSSVGIFALKQALAVDHDVTVVAPDRPQSATGHAITLHKPLRLAHVQLRDGSPAWACSGTPSDCATLGAIEAMADNVDMVVSGINHGPNLGWDVHYSGTVSAAIEAVAMGFPGLALSVASWDEKIHWETAGGIAAKLVAWLTAHPLPPFTVLNVNVPNVAPGDVRGVRVCKQGRRQYVDRIQKRDDPLGRPYYWLAGSLAEEAHLAEPDSDVRAVSEGFVSIVPIQLDMTAYPLLSDLQPLAEQLYP